MWRHQFSPDHMSETCSYLTTGQKAWQEPVASYREPFGQLLQAAKSCVRGQLDVFGIHIAFSNLDGELEAIKSGLTLLAVRLATVLDVRGMIAGYFHFMPSLPLPSRPTLSSSLTRPFVSVDIATTSPMALEPLVQSALKRAQKGFTCQRHQQQPPCHDNCEACHSHPPCLVEPSIEVATPPSDPIRSAPFQHERQPIAHKYQYQRTHQYMSDDK